MGRVIEAFAQFLDDAGDPLANGWLKFLESGSTSTLKGTYSDDTLLVANSNPLQLDAAGRCSDVFGTGSYRVVSFTENIEDDADVGTQVQMFDPVEVANTATVNQGFDTWDLTVTYGLGDIVAYSNQYYRSIIVTNLNKNPSTEVASWEEIEFVPAWNTNATYSINDLVHYGDRIYSSLQSSNTGNQPDTSLTYWAATVLVGDSIGTAIAPVTAVYATTITATTGNITTVAATTGNITTVNATTVDATSFEISSVAITATAGEINTACHGITATAAEINTACYGITATASEINTACDGITATASEINTACDGITATASELNSVCDGNTATAAEIVKAADGIGVTIPRQKVMEIGDWDMDGNSGTTIAHGLTYTKIIGLRALIRNDTDSYRLNIDKSGAAATVAGYIQAGSTLITLGRIAGGEFDSTDFDSTSYNRGWVIIDYID